MSADVTVAVVANGAVHAYHRNGRDLAQVAQFAVGAEVDPAAIAAAMADMGDLFGWHGVGAAVRPAPPAVALPAPPAAAPPSARPKQRPRGRPAAAAVDAERLAVLAAITERPGIMRVALAQLLNISLPTVKRRTDELLRADLIDARPLPGVRERGPGGGHGLFALHQPPAQVS